MKNVVEVLGLVDVVAFNGANLTWFCDAGELCFRDYDDEIVLIVNENVDFDLDDNVLTILDDEHEYSFDLFILAKPIF